MRRHLVRVAALAVAAAVIAACGASDEGVGAPNDDPDPALADEQEDTDTDEPEEAEEAGEATPIEDPAGADEPALEAPTDLAVRDAAGAFGVAEEDVEVVASELVTWNDGSLGCPRPGEMYTQALVDGYRIIVRVDGVEHVYHGAEGEDPFRCEDPADPGQPGGTVDR